MKNGGIYVIDASIQFDWTKLSSENWTMIKNGLTLNVTWRAIPINYVAQKITERLTIEVIKNGERKILETEKISKIIFPQEFLELINKHGKFEFVGWYSNFDLAEPLEKTTRFNRPMTVLRRK